MFAEELQLSGAMSGLELLQEQSPEQAREHAHRQEETFAAGDPTLAVQRHATPGHDTVHMRMMGHGRAPSVEHGGEPDLRAETLGIGGYRGERLGGGLEQQIGLPGF